MGDRREAGVGVSVSEEQGRTPECVGVSAVPARVALIAVPLCSSEAHISWESGL